MNKIKYLIFTIKAALFYISNCWKFKHLAFKANIIKPLRLNGAKYMSIGTGATIQSYSWLIAWKIDNYDPELSIGPGCAIGDFNHIAAVRKVIIGNNVLTANRVYISDNLHSFEDITKPVMHQPIKFKSEVIIGDGAWLGENVCIIGAKVGKNSVIGANSVVTRDIPDFCVAVGSPAKVIKRYNASTKVWDNV